MKLSEFINVLECQMVEVNIPVKDDENSETRWFMDAADMLFENNDIPSDAEVDAVTAVNQFVIDCKPYPFPPEEDGDETFDVEFSSEEMKLIEELADGWIMTPNEVVQKIVKEYLKSIEEAQDYE